MPRRRIALWVASLAAVHTAASAVPLNELFMRQSSCAANFNRCKNAEFPDYFCCPSDQRCIALAGNTTVLCCPEGSECLRIQPLPCDISLQDGEKNPDAVVKTTALRGTLARCGGQCCPFGYSCEKGECVRDANQNAAPIQTSSGKPGPTSTGSARTSATSDAGSGPTADTTSPADGASTTSGSDAEASSGPPVAAVAGGVTAAVVVLIAAAVLAFFFLRKKKKKASEAGSPPKLSRSTSSFGNMISNPIMAQDGAFRSDFARVPGPRDAGGDAGGGFGGDAGNDPDSVTAALIDSSVNSPEAGAMLAVPPAAAQRPDRLSATGYGGYGGLQPSPFQPSPFVDMPYVDHDSGLVPQTPRQHREPSSVSINVFADPNITPDRTPESNADRRYTNMTTFTQMLDKADLGGMARGESYVAYSPNGGQGAPQVQRR